MECRSFQIYWFRVKSLNAFFRLFISKVAWVERILETPSTGATAHAPERKPSQSEDLFSAHNFDITINLDIPAPGTGTNRETDTTCLAFRLLVIRI